MRRPRERGHQAHRPQADGELAGTTRVPQIARAAPERERQRQPGKPRDEPEESHHSGRWPRRERIVDRVAGAALDRKQPLQRRKQRLVRVVRDRLHHLRSRHGPPRPPLRRHFPGPEKGDRNDEVEEHEKCDGPAELPPTALVRQVAQDRKSTRLNSSHGYISYAVFCLKKKKTTTRTTGAGQRAAREYTPH